MGGPGPGPGPDPGTAGDGSTGVPDGDLPDGDLPEAAARRLTSGSFSSGLSVDDLAACLHMGLRPVGLVQGFCVMQQAWYGQGSGGIYTQPARGSYVTQWNCPHGFVSAEHRTYGQNFELASVEAVWADGFGSAYRRLLEEAGTLGAVGVIGVVDRVEPLADMGVTEFHLMGTAVVVDGAPPPSTPPFATYLAGQRLAKLVEAGYVPVAIAAALASVRVWASCVTGYLMEGTGMGVMGMGMGGGGRPQEVEQVSEAHTAVRRIVCERVRHQVGGDSLHGAALEVVERTFSEGDEVIEAVLRGTRVRRFRDAAPMAPPRPTVRLS